MLILATKIRVSFREYNQFLLQNTDGAYLFYDEENETNLKYLYREMKNQEQYFIKKLTFDDLNEVAEIFFGKVGYKSCFFIGDFVYNWI